MITTEISPFLLLSQVSLFSSSAFFLIFFKFYFYFYSRYLDEKSARKRKIDLVAVISGGAEVTRGLHRNITLNASLSYDPDVAHANQPRMKFTWHYGKVPGIPFSKQAEAKADKDFITAVHESAIQYYGKASGEQISLNTKAMSVNQTYIVKLVVTKDIRISTVYQVIHLIEGDPPEIYQRLEIYFVFSVIILFVWFVFTDVFFAVVNIFICS